MKITVIHNLYKRNSFVNECVRYNLKALENFDYQYILFNDNGDLNIKKDVDEFLNCKNVEYFYSEKNWGMKMCSGGWVGAIPLIKGDYIHNIGQDDIYTTYFYKNVLKGISEGFKVIVQNGFKINEDMTIAGILLNPNFKLPYEDKPFECFKFWFGVDEENNITRENNNFPAPGVVYKKDLHDIIGEPDLINFKGAADFEYWSRILFNNIKCKVNNNVTWFYRLSKYSASNEIIDGKSNGEYWNKIYISNVGKKYQKLLKKN